MLAASDGCPTGQPRWRRPELSERTVMALVTFFTGVCLASGFIFSGAFPAFARDLGISEQQAATMPLWFAGGAIAGSFIVTFWLGSRCRAHRLAPIALGIAVLGVAAAGVGGFQSRCVAVALVAMTTFPAVALVHSAMSQHLRQIGYSRQRAETTIAISITFSVATLALLYAVGAYLLTISVTLTCAVLAGALTLSGTMLGLALWDEPPERTELRDMGRAFKNPLVICCALLQWYSGHQLNSLDSTQQSVLMAEPPPAWLIDVSHGSALAWLGLEPEGLYPSMVKLLVLLGAITSLAMLLAIRPGISVGVGVVMAAAGWAFLLLGEWFLRGQSSWLAAHAWGQWLLEHGTTVLSTAGVAIAIARVSPTLAAATAAWMTIGKQAGGLTAGRVIAHEWTARDDFLAVGRWTIPASVIGLVLVAYLLRVLHPASERHELNRLIRRFAEVREAADHVVGSADALARNARAVTLALDKDGRVRIPTERALARLGRWWRWRSPLLLRVGLLDGDAVAVVKARLDEHERGSLLVCDTRLPSTAVLAGAPLFWTPECVTKLLLQRLGQQWRRNAQALDALLHARTSPLVELRERPPWRALRASRVVKAGAAELVAMASHPALSMLLRLAPERDEGERVVALLWVRDGVARRPQLALVDSERRGELFLDAQHDLRAHLVEALAPLAEPPFPLLSDDEPGAALLCATGPVPPAESRRPAAQAVIVGLRARDESALVLPWDANSELDVAVALAVGGLVFDRRMVERLGREDGHHELYAQLARGRPVAVLRETLDHVVLHGFETWTVDPALAARTGMEVHVFTPTGDGGGHAVARAAYWVFRHALRPVRVVRRRSAQGVTHKVSLSDRSPVRIETRRARADHRVQVTVAPHATTPGLDGPVTFSYHGPALEKLEELAPDLVGAH